MIDSTSDSGWRIFFSSCVMLEHMGIQQSKEHRLRFVPSKEKEKNFFKFLFLHIVPRYFVPFFVLAFATKYFGLLSSVGGYCIFKLFFRFLWWIKAFLLTSTADLSPYGKWAVITGSTSGIGLAFAHEIAKQNMNLVLISRSTEKLQQVAQEIESKYSVKTKIFPIDFTKVDLETYEKLTELLKELEDVGVLINNVGVASELPTLLHEASDKEIQDTINININATVNMTRKLIPFMIRRKKGAIVNISSGSANQATPMLTTYASTKAFVNHFSKCIAYEYEQDGIDVLCVTPFYVVSNMSKFRRATWLIPSAERCARDSLKYVGRYHIINPYWVHSVMDFLMSIYTDHPRALLEMMKRNRKKALDRMAIREKKN